MVSSEPAGDEPWEAQPVAVPQPAVVCRRAEQARPMRAAVPKGVPRSTSAAVSLPPEEEARLAVQVKPAARLAVAPTAE